MNIVHEGGVHALVKSIMDGKVRSTEVAGEIVRTLTLISYEYEAIIPLMDSHIFLVLHILYRKGFLVPQTGEMVGLLIRNLVINSKTHTKIVESGALLLFRALYDPLIDKSVAFARAITIIASELGTSSELHEHMIEQGIIAMLHQVVLPAPIEDNSKYTKLFPVKPSSSYGALVPDVTYNELAREQKQYSLNLSCIDIRRITDAFYYLSTTNSTHSAIVDAEYTAIIRKLLDTGKVDYDGMLSIAKCTKNLSSSKVCRQKLVDTGAVEILLEITRASMKHSKGINDINVNVHAIESHGDRSLNIHEETQSACTVALGYLSEITHVASGDVSSLLDLKSHRENAEKQAQAEVLAVAEREKLPRSRKVVAEVVPVKDRIITLLL